MESPDTRHTLTTEVRFQKLWERLGHSDGDSILFTQLMAAYLQPHRAYHTLEHIEECLKQFDSVRDEAAQPEEIELALWFHDAVYHPAATDNEEQSAIWAMQAMQAVGASPAVIDRVRSMIIATQHQQTPTTKDCELLLDIDLSILGQEPERFAAYEEGIRKEYGWVPEAQYRTGRIAILERFLSRPVLYYTQVFRDRMEDRARQNLSRLIAALR